MNKHIAVLLAIVLMPTLALAQGNGNGNGTGNLTFATSSGLLSMHMDIVSNGGTRTFQWDNTPWHVDQGGTGRTSFTNGSVLFYFNGFSEDNANFFWDSTSRILTVGGGVNITSGCYAINGVCINTGGGPSGNPADNFESYDNEVINGGDGGTGWVDRWNGLFTNASRFAVQDTVVYAGSKAIKGRVAAGVASPSITRTFTPRTSGTLHFAARNDSQLSNRSVLAFSLLSGSTAVLRLDMGQRNDQFVQGPFWSVPVSGASGVVQPYVPETWEAVDLQFDTTTDMFRISINGAAYSDWYSFVASARTIDGLRIQFSGTGTVTADAYVDDVRISE